jgi:hypothetical protein
VLVKAVSNHVRRSKENSPKRVVESGDWKSSIASNALVLCCHSDSEHTHRTPSKTQPW